MAFKDIPGQQSVVRLLQRSLEHGRLAHAYLFSGPDAAELETVAGTLARTLNCLQPVRGADGKAIDCCETCSHCRKFSSGNMPDLHWIRPESKSRVITIDQVRDLMQQIHLKATEAEYKVAIVAGADRMNAAAANAFLKTLEEPPPGSVLILLSTDPQRLLETILSRCLRLSFGGGSRKPVPAEMDWLKLFSEQAAAEHRSLLSRYRLLDSLLQQLTAIKSATEETLSARSPIEQHDDVEPGLRERWEDELAAAIEAEYRRQRSDLLALLQRWLRDVWIQSLGAAGGLLEFPELPGTGRLAARLTPAAALENLDILESTQRSLHTNVQEALALEVGLLKLHL
ncbi:MAG: DNA polymerase III subunit [Verrucomicrobiota bacterium]